MPIGNRARRRDVFLYDLASLTLLGGLVLTPGITNALFYAMTEIVAVVPTPFYLQNDNGEEVPHNDDMLLPGNYFIVADGHVAPSSERVLPRNLSVSFGSRIRGFRDAVRERDGRCVVTQRPNLLMHIDDWGGFEAAHIFPLAREGDWGTNDFGRWISLPPPTGGTINSVQNGLLLDAGIHPHFDSYIFSINPDDKHKIVFFQPDSHGIAGTFLDRALLDDPRRPSDELLRWHFRQAVLANMRGEGEPIFEHDFPPGEDMMGDIRTGPKAAERMEAELFGRFAVQMELEY